MKSETHEAYVYVPSIIFGNALSIDNEETSDMLVKELNTDVIAKLYNYNFIKANITLEEYTILRIVSGGDPIDKIHGGSVAVYKCDDRSKTLMSNLIAITKCQQKPEHTSAGTVNVCVRDIGVSHLLSAYSWRIKKKKTRDTRKFYYSFGSYISKVDVLSIIAILGELSERGVFKPSTIFLTELGHYWKEMLEYRKVYDQIEPKIESVARRTNQLTRVIKVISDSPLEFLQHGIDPSIITFDDDL